MRKGFSDYIAHDCRSSKGIGNLVECINCQKIMLVDINTEDCPLCKMKECLQWADFDYGKWDGTEENLTLV